MSRACISMLSLFTASIQAPGDSVYRWPNVLGTTWMFDQGSNFGYLADKNLIRGPSPDWALGNSQNPTLTFDVLNTDTKKSSYKVRRHVREPHLGASAFPGTLVLEGSTASGMDLRVQHAFANANLSGLSVSTKAQPTQTTVRFNVSGSAPNATVSSDGRLMFDQPSFSGAPCFDRTEFSQGSLLLSHQGTLTAELGAQSPTTSFSVTWTITANNRGAFSAVSSPIRVPAGHSATTSALISTTSAFPNTTQDGSEIVIQAITRWDAYLDSVLNTRATSDYDMSWATVKSVMTLLGNWRFVPGKANTGVLPSYTGYGSGMWSWDTYKQAVGMVGFIPDLAKDQLRLLVSAADPKTGHIPDKIDRCGVGGGCAGKPPLLSWAVWEVYVATKDKAFLAEMFPEIVRFHHWWYVNRDVRGVGLCSWSEGMESGMDDGARFTNATSVSNQTAHGFNFWSVDLNAYLYNEKRVLAAMAKELGNSSCSRLWTADADQLLPRLQATFFLPDTESSDRGFFQDAYYNGSFLPIRGCEGYAALFCGVATSEQSLKMAAVLGDSTQFLLNFSVPTLDKTNPQYNEHGYWKGPTWLDQTWFVYTGLRRYAAQDVMSNALSALAAEIKRRVFTVGQGYSMNDTTPLNEHYDASTGQPLGATHFSWSAAHTILWATEPN